MIKNLLIRNTGMIGVQKRKATTPFESSPSQSMYSGYNSSVKSGGGSFVSRFQMALTRAIDQPNGSNLTDMSAPLDEGDITGEIRLLIEELNS
jgi:hypothetical protein